MMKDFAGSGTMITELAKKKDRSFRRGLLNEVMACWPRMYTVVFSTAAGSGQLVFTNLSQMAEAIGCSSQSEALLCSFSFCGLAKSAGSQAYAK